MRVTIKLIIVFVIYVVVNVGYYALLNSSINFGLEYTTWNEITKTVLTVICVSFLYISLFIVYRVDYEPLKKNIILISMALLYSGILFYLMDSQLFILKAI